MKKLLCLCFSLLLIQAQAQELPEKILFVGNSYTYFWNLPQTVDLMIESDNVTEVDTDHSTAGGANWAQHWRGEKGLKTQERIRKGDYDAVILQNHSMSTIQRADSFQIFGEKLYDLAESTGADVYLYMTWARAWNPYMQEKITAGYKQIAEKTGAHIVPVGPAWQRSHELRPDLALHDPDGSHPNTTGTYLTACVFYNILTQKSPVGLPHRLITEDKDGETLYLTIQNANDALFCQKVAEEVVEKMSK